MKRISIFNENKSSTEWQFDEVITNDNYKYQAHATATALN